MKTRIEKDTLGEVEVPEEAYYGAQTVRALANFPISGLRPHPSLVWATVVIKKSAAKANMSTGRLPASIGAAIIQAADEALGGSLKADFVVDPFQAGAGTSHNMNVNEVLANRAAEILGGKRGDYGLVHPNDHVNMAQSTNDVFPTAMRLASLRLLYPFISGGEALRDALLAKGREFDHILKSGRTHLQDAVPIRLGQEFAAYGAAIDKNISAIKRCIPLLLDLGIGGTAIGTGLNAEEHYIAAVVDEIARETAFRVTRAENPIETTQNMDSFVALSSAQKRLALNVSRIANDLRLLASGPRTGLAEIVLPAVQPGSSIMPGKVNPSIPEMTNMVCFQVMGGDTVITMAANAGQLELNVMMPVIAYNLLFGMEIFTNAINKFTTDCISGIIANEERCRRYMHDSLGLVTILAPHIGYEAAAEVAKESAKTGRSLVEIIGEKGILSSEKLAAVLDPYPLTAPGIPGKKED